MTLRYLLIVLLGLTGCHTAQKHYQLIYRNFPGVYQTEPTHVRTIRVRRYPYEVEVKTDSGRTKTVATNGLWGCQETGGTRHRLYLGSFYEVVQEKTFVIYRQADFGGLSSDHYYFSRTPDSDILYLNRQNLAMAFSNETCMQTIASQLPRRDWFKLSSSGHYRLLDAYDHCLSLK